VHLFLKIVLVKYVSIRHRSVMSREKTKMNTYD
jgi:hypothetical protein